LSEVVDAKWLSMLSVGVLLSQFNAADEAPPAKIIKWNQYHLRLRRGPRPLGSEQVGGKDRHTAVMGFRFRALEMARMIPGGRASARVKLARPRRPPYRLRDEPE
jgi:hypothetical protein